MHIFAYEEANMTRNYLGNIRKGSHVGRQTLGAIGSFLGGTISAILEFLILIRLVFFAAVCGLSAAAAITMIAVVFEHLGFFRLIALCTGVGAFLGLVLTIRREYKATHKRRRRRKNLNRNTYDEYRYIKERNRKSA